MRPLCLLLIVGFAHANWAQDAATEIELAVKNIGHAEFEKREAATKVLARHGELARKALEEAARSEDFEASRRAKTLLEELYQKGVLADERRWIVDNLGPVCGVDKFGPLPAPQPGADGSDTEPATAPPEKATHDGILRWLAGTQAADGYWSSRQHGAQTEADVEQTSLALLAFLYNRQTDRFGQYKVNIRAAKMWLLSQIGEDGLVSQQPSAIRQALAVSALSETLGLSLRRNKDDAERVEKAVAALTREFQLTDGKYAGAFQNRRIKDGVRNADLLSTTYATSALKSARVSGLKIEIETLRKAAVSVANFRTDTKRAGFALYKFGEGAKPGVRASWLALYALALTGTSGETLRDEVDALQVLDTHAVGDVNGDGFLDGWKGITLFLCGGDHWKNFRNAATVNLPRCREFSRNWEWSGGGSVLYYSILCQNFALLHAGCNCPGH
ncbi:MAG TPA: hypothetical protein VEJ63_00255 [Planctomycetota bacterium]|nr:hypothetical protein [Planctomycetota bacterium]